MFDHIRRNIFNLPHDNFSLNGNFREYDPEGLCYIAHKEKI
jgi:hypothetical protein